MKKRILILTIILCAVFSNQKIFAQSYKSEHLSFYNFVFPDAYIPKGYRTYTVKMNLSDRPIAILIDGEKKGGRGPLSYNEFFKKEYLVRPLAGTETEVNYKGEVIPSIADLGYRNEPSAKADDHLILDVLIDHIAYAAEIQEAKSAEKPFGYEMYYQYNVFFKFKNSVTDAVVLEKSFFVKQRMSATSASQGTIFNFKTRPEAVNYLTENADKNLIYNELVTDIQRYMKSRVVSWVGVAYYQDTYLFSRISKEDKNPIFVKLNQDVDAMENWSKSKPQPTVDDALLASNTDFIEKNNLTIKDNSEAFHGDVNLRDYKNFINKKRVFTDFILKMDGYSKQLDANDKGQKAAIWACYINIAASFAVLNNYKSSLEFLEKARSLEYQERKIQEVEKEIKDRQAKLNIFYAADGGIKNDVNNNYIKYLTL